MLHTHLQLHVALTRTSGRRQWTSQKAIRTTFDSEVLSLSLICQTDEPCDRGYTMTIYIHPPPGTSFCRLISHVPFSGVQHAYTKTIYPWRAVVNESTASRDGAAGMPASSHQLHKTQHTHTHTHTHTHKPVWTFHKPENDRWPQHFRTVRCFLPSVLVSTQTQRIWTHNAKLIRDLAIDLHSAVIDISQTASCTGDHVQPSRLSNFSFGLGLHLTENTNHGR